MIRERDGETTKIYHLPFDQMYDKGIVGRNNSDCYVKTVLEAVELGFVRAKKYIPDYS